ncbi:hypothetical protein [Nostoc sp.]|uniref:hypothetical protein n=1 Tax=Nostoc sp. TaxID=1180 RepID=UPI002FFABDDB
MGVLTPASTGDSLLAWQECFNVPAYKSNITQQIKPRDRTIDLLHSSRNYSSFHVFEPHLL